MPRPFVHGLAFGLGLIFLGVVAGWLLRREAASSAVEASGGLVGQPAPDFTLQDLDGRTWHLRDLQGRVVVLNMWATWCEPCKVEMPLLQTLAVNHPHDVVILGVNYGEDPAAVQAFAQKYGLTFPLLLDPERVVVRRYGARGLPTTVFIDRDGIVRGIHLGALSPDDVRAQLHPLGVEP